MQVSSSWPLLPAASKYQFRHHFVCWRWSFRAFYYLLLGFLHSHSLTHLTPLFLHTTHSPTDAMNVSLTMDHCTQSIHLTWRPSRHRLFGSLCHRTLWVLLLGLQRLRTEHVDPAMMECIFECLERVDYHISLTLTGEAADAQKYGLY